MDLYAEKFRNEDLIKAFPNEPKSLGFPVKETFDFIIGEKKIQNSNDWHTLINFGNKTTHFIYLFL